MTDIITDIELRELLTKTNKSIKVNPILYDKIDSQVDILKSKWENRQNRVIDET